MNRYAEAEIFHLVEKTCRLDLLTTIESSELYNYFELNIATANAYRIAEAVKRIIQLNRVSEKNLMNMLMKQCLENEMP